MTWMLCCYSGGGEDQAVDNCSEAEGGREGGRDGEKEGCDWWVSPTTHPHSIMSCMYLSCCICTYMYAISLESDFSKSISLEGCQTWLTIAQLRSSLIDLGYCNVENFYTFSMAGPSLESWFENWGPLSKSWESYSPLRYKKWNSDDLSLLIRKFNFL